MFPSILFLSITEAHRGQSSLSLGIDTDLGRNQQQFTGVEFREHCNISTSCQVGHSNTSLWIFFLPQPQDLKLVCQYKIQCNF